MMAAPRRKPGRIPTRFGLIRESLACSKIGRFSHSSASEKGGWNKLGLAQPVDSQCRELAVAGRAGVHAPPASHLPDQP